MGVLVDPVGLAVPPVLEELGRRPGVVDLVEVHPRRARRAGTSRRKSAATTRTRRSHRSSRSSRPPPSRASARSGRDRAGPAVRIRPLSARRSPCPACPVGRPGRGDGGAGRPPRAGHDASGRGPAGWPTGTGRLPGADPASMRAGGAAHVPLVRSAFRRLARPLGRLPPAEATRRAPSTRPPRGRPPSRSRRRTSGSPRPGAPSAAERVEHRLQARVLVEAAMCRIP